MLHDHPIDRRLLQAQAASGALFALFLTVHLVNTMAALAGPAAYDAVQGPLRAAYQVPPLEVALVAGPLVVHVISSVWRMLRRRRLAQPAPRAVRTRLQRYSAIVLLAFTGGHVLATRGSSLIFDVWPGFAGVAFTIVYLPAVFIPYYTLFSIAALYHLVHGMTVALPRLGLRAPTWLRSDRAVMGTTLVGSLLLVLGIAGFVLISEEMRAEAIDSGYARVLEKLGLVDRTALVDAP